MFKNDEKVKVLVKVSWLNSKFPKIFPWTKRKSSSIAENPMDGDVDLIGDRNRSDLEDRMDLRMDTRLPGATQSRGWTILRSQASP